MKENEKVSNIYIDYVPAVSQISNLIMQSGRVTVCVRKAAPMVGCWNSKNSFLTKRSTVEDLPTAASPIRGREVWEKCKNLSNLVRYYIYRTHGYSQWRNHPIGMRLNITKIEEK